MQCGTLCHGGRKILFFIYLELNSVYISTAVQLSQLLMLCSRARFRAFPFFSEFLFLFSCLFTVPSYLLYPFLCIFRPIRLRTFSSGSVIPFCCSQVFLQPWHSEACWLHEGVWEGALAGATGTCAPLPPLSSASPSQGPGSHHRASRCPPFSPWCSPSTVTHDGQIQKKAMC